MIQAKMNCLSVLKHKDFEEVVLTPVYSPDRNDPNYSWSQATPSGHVKLTITNPAALGKFLPGADYIIDFSAWTP